MENISDSGQFPGLDVSLPPFEFRDDLVRSEAHGFCQLPLAHAQGPPAIANGLCNDFLHIF